MNNNNNTMLLLARNLGAVIISSADILHKEQKNLVIKKDVFDNYLLDNFVYVYIKGRKTINTYRVVMFDENSYTLLFVEKLRYEYFLETDENSC